MFPFLIQELNNPPAASLFTFADDFMKDIPQGTVGINSENRIILYNTTDNIKYDVTIEIADASISFTHNIVKDNDEILLYTQNCSKPTILFKPSINEGVITFFPITFEKKLDLREEQYQEIQAIINTVNLSESVTVNYFLGIMSTRAMASNNLLKTRLIQLSNQYLDYQEQIENCIEKKCTIFTYTQVATIVVDEMLSTIISDSPTIEKSLVNLKAITEAGRRIFADSNATGKEIEKAEKSLKQQIFNMRTSSSSAYFSDFFSAKKNKQPRVSPDTVHDLPRSPSLIN
jgi:hypothetical protein